MGSIPRIIAGAFCGAGSLLLIYTGYVTEGCIILGTMVGFFVGEKNGEKNSVK